MAHALTPSQTVGPFHHIELPRPGGGHLVAPGSAGAIRIVGRVVDGASAPVDDALIEVWQADPSGRFHDPTDDRDLPLRDGFTGFGRVATGADGSYELWTLKPGPVPGPGGHTQAPHLVTRLYFPDETQANAADPILALVADPADRATLVATADSEAGTLRFDIHLQGERETVFLAYPRHEP